MSSHLSQNKKFWAKDMAKNGVEIHDLSFSPREVVKRFPEMTDKKIVETLSDLDK